MFIFIIGLLSSFPCFSGSHPELDSEITHPLFTISRSTNSNVIHYDARLVTPFQIKTSDPIDVYWLMHAKEGASKGEREELTWLEQNKAYGFSIVGDIHPTSLKMTIRSFPNRQILVSIHHNEVRAEMQILGESHILKNVHVQASSGLFPSVESIELIGVHPATKETVKELIRL